MKINLIVLSNVSNMILSLHHNSNTYLKPATTENSGNNKMKTQISSLVKGDHREGIAGTNSEIRNEIATKVRNENPEEMTIEINGEKVTLKAEYSQSRKSVWYNASISLDLYRHFIGEFGLPKQDPKAFISIWGDMNVVLTSNSKKSMFHYIAESNVTIL